MSACLRSACVARARRRFPARKRLVNAKGSAAGSPIPPPGRPTSLARAARIRVVRSVGHQDALHLAHFVRTGMLAKRVGIAEILIPDLRCKAHEQPAGGPADAETPVPFLARVGSMSLRNEVPQPQECGRRCAEMGAEWPPLQARASNLLLVVAGSVAAIAVALAALPGAAVAVAGGAAVAVALATLARAVGRAAYARLRRSRGRRRGDRT
jgi:hypothetical protein